MKRLLFLIAVAALALPATASAKGPSEATITGPGLGKAIRITGPEAEGSPLMDLAEAAGFFPAAFGQTPDPMAYARPKGDLGPRYSIDYVVPALTTGTTRSTRISIRTRSRAPGRTWPQASRSSTFETHGGWFTDSRIKGILVARGLPKAPPTTSSKSSSSAGFFSNGKIGAFVLVLFGIGAAAVLTRRHLRGTAT